MLHRFHHCDKTVLILSPSLILDLDSTKVVGEHVSLFHSLQQQILPLFARSCIRDSSEYHTKKTKSTPEPLVESVARCNPTIGITT